MFKKLRDKITEEVKQSPLKFQASVQQFTQAVSPTGSNSLIEAAANEHFVISEDDIKVPVSLKSQNKSDTKHDENLTTLPLSRRSSLSSVSNDLFPIYENSCNFYQFQSDLESNASEIEDSFSTQQLDNVTKEKLYAAYQKIQARYHKYKGRYTDLVRHYKRLEQENQKAKSILSETQDKAFRRIAELKEQCQLEQKAKAHLEEVLRNDIEEKDHLIKSLNTKIGFLKNGSEGDIETGSLSKTNSSSDSPSDLSLDVPSFSHQISFSEVESALKEKIRKLEGLLLKSKDSIAEKVNAIKELTKENAELKNNEAVENVKILDEMKHQLLISESKFTETIQRKDDEIENLKIEEIKLKEKLELKISELEELKMRMEESIEKKNGEIESLKENLRKNLDEMDKLKNNIEDVEVDSDIKAPVMCHKQEESLVELRNIIETLKTELTEKENKLKHINEHSSSNSTKLNLSLEKVSQMESDFRLKSKEWLQTKEQYQKQIDSYVKEISKLKETLKEAQEKCKQREEQTLLQHKSEVSKLNLNLTSVTNDYLKIVQEKEKFEKEVSHLTNELRKYSTESSKTEQMHKELATLLSSLEAKEEELKNQSTALEQKKSEVTALSDKNLNLSLKIDSLDKIIQDKNDTIVNLKSKLEEVQNKSEFDVSKLQNLNKELTQKLQQFENSLALKEEEIRNYTSSIKNLENSVKFLKEQIDVSNKEKEIAENAMEGDCEKLRENLKKQENSLKEITSKIIETEQKLSVSEQSKKYLEDKLIEVKDKLDKSSIDKKEFLKIENLLSDNNFSVERPLSTIIEKLITSLKNNVLEKGTMKDFQTELENGKNVSAQSLSICLVSIQNLKTGIVNLKQDFTKIAHLNCKEYTKLINDCLNYSRKLVTDKEESLSKILRVLQQKEEEAGVLQKKLKENIEIKDKEILAKTAEIELMTKKIQDLTVQLQILEESAKDNSEKNFNVEKQLLAKNEIIEELESNLCKIKASLNNVESLNFVQLNEKEKEIQRLKTAAKYLENEEKAAENERNLTLIQQLKDQIDCLNTELTKYKVFGEKLKEEKAISDRLKYELEDSKQEYEKLKHDYEAFMKNETLLANNDPKISSQSEIEKLEDSHKKIVQEVERRYETLLEEKNQDLEDLRNNYLELSVAKESSLNADIKSIIKDFEEDKELQSKELEEFHLKLKLAEKTANVNIEKLKQEHLIEMNETIKKWKECLVRKISELEKKHSEEIAALTKEWNYERKTTNETLIHSDGDFKSQELEAWANSTQSEKGSIESLNVKIGTLKQELSEEKRLHRLEVHELQKLLSARKTGNQAKEKVEENLEDCTEMEYLRNILYEYMMGKEPVVLARVLAAIVKFDSDQTNKVLQKEEQRFTMLGQLGLL